MWTNIKNNNDIEELKKSSKCYGGFQGIVTLIKSELGIDKNTFSSWNGLNKFLIFFNNSYKKIESNENSLEDKYFKSKSARYIFCLTELDGELRAELLGITREHYSNLYIARKWKNEIVKEIHPDICLHEQSKEAMVVLNSIYEGMKKYGK